MTESVTDEPKSDTQDAPGGQSRAATWSVAAIIGLLVLTGFIRVVAQPVLPDQKEPRLHPAGGCALCHVISEDVERIDVE